MTLLIEAAGFVLLVPVLMVTGAFSNMWKWMTIAFIVVVGVTIAFTI